ncbi:MAG: NUDIX domain-containing protein [Phycisphaerales bacterium]|nr:NUDIX domain-containing protein [Phycisphaerales bacterium]
MTDGKSPPRYCCAILRDQRGWYVLERRPESDPDAPGRLTFFGGGREEGEEPLACLAREVWEELGFAVDTARAQRVFTLATPSGPAWFYLVPGPEPGTVQANEPGYAAVWMAEAELAAATLADWHRAAWEGFAAGRAFGSVV